MSILDDAQARQDRALAARKPIDYATGKVVTVVVETDGGAYFIPAKLVIAWKEIV